MPTTDETVDALATNLEDMSGILDQYIAFVVAQDAVQKALRDEIAALLAGNAALAAKVDAAFQRSIAIEDKARAGLPGAPPVGGQPLLSGYADKASFDAAVAAYTGVERVNLDGVEVKAGTDPALDYYTHSDSVPPGAIDINGPTS